MIESGKSEDVLGARTPLYVTRPFLPPLSEYLPYLEKIWEARHLTNGGPMHVDLEAGLSEYLGVECVSLFANATLALIAAQRVLGLTGSVVTTPFSFVATASSILWNGLRPIFCDIQSDTMNIDPEMIERAIEPDTSAILAVHCYGHRCDVAAIEDIARRRGLKMVYDAAHAFGVRDAGGSILRYGDVSVASFHATKVFHTFEGGAIVCSKELKAEIDRFRNFGFINEETIEVAGFNCKLNEVSAAMGLLQLRHVQETITSRRRVDALYRSQLSGCPGIRLLDLVEGEEYNYAYFPIRVEAEFGVTRDELVACLAEQKIVARRYFYPLIPGFEPFRRFGELNDLSRAAQAAEMVLCLPLFPDMDDASVERVTNVIWETHRLGQ